MKYGLSPREIPRAEPEEFLEGSGDISSYTPTQVTIQSFSIISTSQYFLRKPNTDPYYTRKYWRVEGVVL